MPQASRRISSTTASRFFSPAQPSPARHTRRQPECVCIFLAKGATKAPLRLPFSLAAALSFPGPQGPLPRSALWPYGCTVEVHVQRRSGRVNAGAVLQKIAASPSLDTLVSRDRGVAVHWLTTVAERLPCFTPLLRVLTAEAGASAEPSHGRRPTPGNGPGVR
jgi:hypothetical protein